MVDSSKVNLQGRNKRYFELEKIGALETFLFGNWRIYRISFGLIIVVFLFFLMAFIKEYIYIPKLDVSIHLEAGISIVTFVFVLVSEGWIWYMRIRIGFVIDTLVNLGDRYNLAAKSSSEKVE